MTPGRLLIVAHSYRIKESNHLIRPFSFFVLPSRRAVIHRLLTWPCMDMHIMCRKLVIFGGFGGIWAVKPPPFWAKRHIIARHFGLGLGNKYRKVIYGRWLRLIFAPTHVRSGVAASYD